MTLSVTTFLIVCPLVCIAGLVDAIGGGGGLISLPAYLFAGIPPHMAVATNKMSSTFGTSIVTARMIKNRLIDFRLAILSIIMAIAGSSIGANLSLLIPEELFLKLMIVILPICAFCVLNRKIFGEQGEEEIRVNRRTVLCAAIAAFFIGIYDGIYGPGTGTFLIIAFTVFAKINVKLANGQAKIINLTTNITSLFIFLMHSQVLIPLGIAASISNMIGGYIGAGLAIKNGNRIIKPCILFVLGLLIVKILSEIL